MTDFGLSGTKKSKKKGGTPLYGGPGVFGGYQAALDSFSYWRLMMFMCLSPPDFIQLTCFPIEDEQVLGEIRNGIKSFAILKYILKQFEKYGTRQRFDDMSQYSKVKISRNDLITAGIDQNWFIDSLPVGHEDTLQLENFNCQEIK